MRIYSNRHWAFRCRALRLRNRKDWGKELFIKLKDTGFQREEKKGKHFVFFLLVRCHQGKKWGELSRTAVSITETEVERKRVSNEEEETRGTRREGRIARPRKSREIYTLRGNFPAKFLHRTKTKLFSLSVCCCIKANSNREGISCIMVISSLFSCWSRTVHMLFFTLHYVNYKLKIQWNVPISLMYYVH